MTLHGDARLLMVESLVLGRAAMGETVAALDLTDRRTITRDGVPVHIEPLAADVRHPRAAFARDARRGARHGDRDPRGAGRRGRACPGSRGARPSPARGCGLAHGTAASSCARWRRTAGRFAASSRAFSQSCAAAPCPASGRSEGRRMNLTPREKDKLLVSLAAMVARGRLARGVKLNHPEAIALITDFVVEGARDGRSRRGPDGGRRACRHGVAVHGGGARDDPRRAGRGDVPRRDETRHGAPPHPMSDAVLLTRAALRRGGGPQGSDPQGRGRAVREPRDRGRAPRGRGRWTPEMVAAALLHDAVEDTEATEATITAAFGPCIATFVAGLDRCAGLEGAPARGAQAPSGRAHRPRAARRPADQDRGPDVEPARRGPPAERLGARRGACLHRGRGACRRRLPGRGPGARGRVRRGAGAGARHARRHRQGRTSDACRLHPRDHRRRGRALCGAAHQEGARRHAPVGRADDGDGTSHGELRRLPRGRRDPRPHLRRRRGAGAWRSAPSWASSAPASSTVSRNARRPTTGPIPTRSDP